MGGKPICAMKVKRVQHAWPSRPGELVCWDPKDGELCLGRMKPGETLVEVRRGSDVQIDRQTWV